MSRADQYHRLLDRQFADALAADGDDDAHALLPARLRGKDARSLARPRPGLVRRRRRKATPSTSQERGVL